jgi:hypothetical protein
LTLAIDESFGAPCITYSAMSSFNRLDDAIENLRERENMPGPKGVGFAVPEKGKQSETAVERHPKALKTIAEWVVTAGFDAAIWAALATNFTEKTKKRFSVKAAIRYLENLDKDAQDLALTYVRNAPPEIQTPLREAIKVRW